MSANEPSKDKVVIGEIMTYTLTEKFDVNRKLSVRIGPLVSQILGYAGLFETLTQKYKSVEEAKLKDPESFEVAWPPNQTCYHFGLSLR